MTHKEFEKLVDELDGDSLATLKKKNAKYAPCEDALRNFHVGAEIMGTTTGECVWGYATKHISSLRDRIKNNNWDDLEDVKEKLQDTINYLRFLWCVANEENKKDEEENIDCSGCQYDELACDDNNWNRGMSSMIVEPCKSCKGNQIRGTKEWKEAKNNYKKMEN